MRFMFMAEKINTWMQTGIYNRRLKMTLENIRSLQNYIFIFLIIYIKIYGGYCSDKLSIADLTSKLDLSCACNAWVVEIPGIVDKHLKIRNVSGTPQGFSA